MKIIKLLLMFTLKIKNLMKKSMPWSVFALKDMLNIPSRSYLLELMGCFPPFANLGPIYIYLTY